MLLGLGTFFLFAGPVLADEMGNSEYQGQALTNQDLAGSGTARVDRWVFGAAGPDRVRAAAEQCSGRTVAAATVHHTGGDVAAAFFSLGIYTPVHVSYACAPAPTH
jgi:hypothetical protein